jgi:putative sterol carrier protein
MTTRVVFGSQEFAEAYCRALNENEAYSEAAREWEGDFVWVATPSGPLDREQKLWIGLHHGRCTGAKVLTDDDKVRLLKRGEERSGEAGVYEVAYIFTTDYLTWKRLVLGEVKFAHMLMRGKAKLEGDRAKAMRFSRAATELGATIKRMKAKGIEIEWL